jgi:hypothetical protein
VCTIHPSKPGDDPESAKATAADTLKNANDLLNYAMEAGIEIDADIAQLIINAGRTGPAIWGRPEAGALAAAIIRLAKKLQPVTAETLRACREDAKAAIKAYQWIVIWLVCSIIPLSMVSFVYTRVSNSIAADLTIANGLAVTLHSQLDALAPKDTGQLAPPGTLADLQQFAATMRAIYSRTRELNWFVLNECYDPIGKHTAVAAEAWASTNPYASMQLPRDVDLSTAGNQRKVTNDLTGVYQTVRIFANSAQDATAIFWGAVATCILPVLYALLGACAYVLRTINEQTREKTFASLNVAPPRFIIAGIGGVVVGLFGNFTVGQGVTLSPLAYAFLIGYAADIFFAFLEGSMQNLRGPNSR